MRRKATIGLAAFGLTAAASAGLPALTPLREHYDKSVPVSGNTLVGLRRGPASAALSLSGLSVEIPKGAAGKLCLAMITRDGRYSGSQDFDLNGAGSGATGLRLQSQKERDGALQLYRVADLAVRFRMRSSCDSGPPGTYLVSQWPGATSSDPLTVYVNVKLSSAVAYLTDEHGQKLSEKPSTCEAITAGSRTAFDHQCTIPASKGAVRSIRLDIYGTTGSHRVETYPIALN